ncbi:hypothetical protein [Oligella ureolytica]|uniref:Uncharacterized protein n=1 Tax=Oligella ureolytica TaxID=90244 RepID=A0A7T3EVZ5_9BURK|nr:hypothetical protein [Oligella ureolytica]QPT40573.1 hypothetical protein I6G29_02985 [Oligella ureolytica]
MQRIHANMANMPPEMTTVELKEFLLATERAINVNLAAAYAGDGSGGALNYLN